MEMLKKLVIYLLLAAIFLFFIGLFLLLIGFGIGTLKGSPDNTYSYK